MSTQHPASTVQVSGREDLPVGLRAAIYARTSSNSQRFGYSIDEQIRCCLEACEQMEWEPTFMFIDEAKSGRDTDRPEFQLMLERARQGLFDVVIFWKLDRFCRSLVDLVKIESELQELGVGLHSVTEFLDTTNPVGRFNFRNLASAAELESDMIGQRVKLGMYGLAREHKWPNQFPPLGYSKRKDGKLEVDSRESRLVRHIFQLYIIERSMPEVAHILNNKEYTPRRQESWCRQSVGKILRNELYIGKYRLAGFEDTVEAYRIVPDSLFLRAYDVRHRFTPSRRSMSLDRKSRITDRILDWYLSRVEEESE